MLSGLIRARWPIGQYAVLFEVRNAPGFNAKRSADAMAIGLWPSRGCEVEGIEIKEQRSDWLRELKEPAKAEAVAKYCDRWWLVTGGVEVAKLEEIPAAWGWLAAKGKKLKVMKAAPSLTPQPIDRFFLAAMLKRATDTAINSPEVRAEIERREKDFRERLKHHESIGLKRANLHADHLEKSIRRFEEASGVKIDGFTAGRIGDAVRRVLSGEIDSKIAALGDIKRQAAELHAWLEENISDHDPLRT